MARMTEEQAQAEINAVAEFCRTQDPKKVSDEELAFQLNRALTAAKVSNKIRALREQREQAARVAAVRHDPVALRKLANENLARRR